MPTLFADSRSGNDANSGASWALAKKTLTAAKNTAINGDTIKCAGVFTENLTLTGRTLTFEAEGVAILDGEGVIDAGFVHEDNTTTVFRGFTIRNCITSGLRMGGFNAINGSLTLEDCVVENCQRGVYVSGNTGNITINLTRTIIRNCSGMGVYRPSVAGVVTINILNSTITGCGRGIYVPGGNTATVKLQNSILSHNSIRHIDFDTNVATSRYSAASNFNDIDFGSGSCFAGSVAITDLATWKGATGADASSISADPLYVDRLKRLHMLTPASPCLVSGSLVFGSLVQGAYNRFPAAGISANVNALQWGTATFEGCSVDGNGNIAVLTTSGLGTAVFTLDLGAPHTIRRIDLPYIYGWPTSVLDYDKSDTLPETWQYRLATSLNGITYTPFSIYKLFDDLNLVNVRFLKLEVTLRKDA